jgi:fructose-bisphosphate aldolase class I
MTATELDTIARGMVAKDKGILAADESTGTIKKRFDKIKLESTEESRRAYRELLFTTPGASDYISAVIFYDETLRQKTREGVAFPEYLTRIGIIPGIKVDTGAKPLAGFPGETITEGLDGLRDRLIEYYKRGARFAKWRAVIDIADGIPTQACIDANAHALGRYAALCQEQKIVPIVEPEVLMDGAHDLKRCEEVTGATLQAVFNQLHVQRVRLEGIVLKPNMVISGMKNAKRASAEEVAEATVRCLKRHVPTAVPGIAFLSGGQGPEEATEHLSLVNQLGPLPWEVSFSYGRALQAPVLDTWRGQQANWAAGQKAFFKRAKLNGLARSGRYAAALESAA